MTPEEAAFRGVIYGGIITLAGTLLTSCIQILLQWLQQKWAMNTEKKKYFAERRLGALQGAVQLCNFLIAARGRSFGPAAKDSWNRIRSENLPNGALMPMAVRQTLRQFSLRHCS